MGTEIVISVVSNSKPRKSSLLQGFKVNVFLLTWNLSHFRRSAVSDSCCEKVTYPMGLPVRNHPGNQLIWHLQHLN